jgi:hypothetical protein
MIASSKASPFGKPGLPQLNRCPRQIEVTGYLGFADSGAVEFLNRAGVETHSRQAAEPFAFQPGFCQSGANALAQQIVFELGKNGE